MAVTGRPRKPDALAIAEGTYRKENSGDPRDQVPAEGIPEPGELQGDALDLWNELVPPLVELGVAKAIDSTQLQRMCWWLARHYKMAKLLDHPDTVETSAEARRLATSLQEAYKMYESIACRFGMDSSSRSGIRLPQQKKAVASRKRG